MTDVKYSFSLFSPFSKRTTEGKQYQFCAIREDEWNAMLLTAADEVGIDAWMPDLFYFFVVVCKWMYFKISHLEAS